MISFFLNLLFPKSCISCKTPGELLCYDCLSAISLHGTIQAYGFLKHVWCASSAKDPITARLLFSFTSAPFLKDLAFPAASLIIVYLASQNKAPKRKHAVLYPVPLSKKEIRYKGYSPAEELAKELSKLLRIPMTTLPQECAQKDVLLVHPLLLNLEELSPFQETLKGSKSISFLAVASQKQ